MKNRERLVDAASRMIKEGKAADEVAEALAELGISREEAESIISDAQSASKKPTGEDKKKSSAIDFWESPSGSFFASREEAKKGSMADSSQKATYSFGLPRTARVDKVDFSIAEAKKKGAFREILPTRVSDFDKLIERGGLKRGDTILLSGGCGTGKTTFSMQSLYHGALHGEKGVYITLEESAEKMKENHMQNFGWDLDGLEREGKLAIIKIDPLTIARAVEAMLTKERGGLYIEFEEFDLPFQLNLPFKPDRVVVDSLSALSIAFMENEQGYRQYLRHLFESLEEFNSSNIVLGETEQMPGVYSRSGIEEFLADGVVVFYNIKIHNIRQKALEILKLRSSNHEKRIVPYKISSNGIEIFINEELFREE